MTSTYQGLYCMTSDGEFLSGNFARQTCEIARGALSEGLQNWQKVVSDRDYKPKPVPTNRLALYGGEKLQKGGLKLEVAYRDLPRGELERPGNARFPNPYNLGWFDLTPAEAKSIVSGSREKTAIPGKIFQKLARTRLKDAVRGQMGDWEEGDIKGGRLFTQLVSTKGRQQVYELSGSALLEAGGRRYEPEFYGSMTFDRAESLLIFVSSQQVSEPGGGQPMAGRRTSVPRPWRLRSLCIGLKSGRRGVLR